MELVINFSGGKDSCAMLAHLCDKYPSIVKHVVYADTGWEHEGAESWCRSIVERFGLTLHVVRNKNKTFLSMVKNRGKFPSPKNRQCTSDLKRDPITTWIRRNVKDKVVINCMGLRADESPARSKKKRLVRNATQTNSKRTVWDYLPIHTWTEAEVLSYLTACNIPLHPVYKYLRRFSCRVCIYMTDHDLRQVQANDPAAIDIISSLENDINFSMKQGKYLKDIINQ